ncbi:pimeloyl-ACP methyl ester carboxylesterase [Kitasatospora sp. MAP12-15]|uniref:alpha/beta fold hydrolase n=1 Tax=unclassified Kitasatospora TaxID=2633591 RepID=UPI002477243B|nr:alpha/beta hydrolase [Kitasatospora sp. MAP12-44]MDH6115076.1 pimeloyl-ACP methyl ester carboxylesterase [Kitasatospora sp. MAP12-44]
MAFLDLDGRRCHVQRLGPRDGRPPAATAVLLHGLLTDSLASYYFTLAPALAAAGVEVLMYDHRGHGRSGRPATGYRLEHFTDDLEALLDRLELTGPLHLLGNSFGGTVAFSLAARRPEQVASILAIESEPASPAWAVKLDGILREAERHLVAEESLAWVAQHRGAHTARLARSAGTLLVGTTLARDIPASRLPSPDELRAIRCPVLAVYGTRSDLAPQAAWLEGLLPDCRSTFVPDQEHSVLIEEPETVRRLAFDWLRENGARLVPQAEGSLR